MRHLVRCFILRCLVSVKHILSKTSNTYACRRHTRRNTPTVLSDYRIMIYIIYVYMYLSHFGFQSNRNSVARVTYCDTELTTRSARDTGNVHWAIIILSFEKKKHFFFSNTQKSNWVSILRDDGIQLWLSIKTIESFPWWFNLNAKH